MVAQRGKLARKCTVAFFVEATWRMSTTTAAPFQDGLMSAKRGSQELPVRRRLPTNQWEVQETFLIELTPRPSEAPMSKGQG